MKKLIATALLFFPMVALANNLIHSGNVMTAPILDSVNTYIIIEGDAALALYNSLTASSVDVGTMNVIRVGKNIFCRTSPSLECTMQMSSAGEITPFN